MVKLFGSIITGAILLALGFGISLNELAAYEVIDEFIYTDRVEESIYTETIPFEEDEMIYFNVDAYAANLTVKYDNSLNNELRYEVHYPKNFYEVGQRHITKRDKEVYLYLDFYIRNEFGLVVDLVKEALYNQRIYRSGQKNQVILYINEKYKDRLSY